MRLLAVDDDDIALELLTGALRGAGYEDVVSASSGAQALKIIAESDQPFDVFLLDIQMPGINGIDLCRQIRGMARFRTAPILMITAMQERRFIDQAFAAGAIDYINKPFDPMELGARVRIAEKLSQQAVQVETTLNEVDYLKSRSGMGTAFKLEDAIEIHDVPSVISMTAMENYLLRLTFRMAVQSKSAVFSIPGFDTLHSHAGPAELYDLLADAAEAIAAGLKYTNHLITYVGGGHFVAVVHGRSARLDEDTQSAVQAAINELEPSFGDGRPCPLAIQMGAPYSAGLWSATERMNLLLRPMTGVQADTGAKAAVLHHAA